MPESGRFEAFLRLPLNEMTAEHNSPRSFHREAVSRKGFFRPNLPLSGIHQPDRVSAVRVDSVMMPVMIFVGGAIAGCVVGLVVGALLQRRSGDELPLGPRRRDNDCADRPRRCRRRGCEQRTRPGCRSWRGWRGRRRRRRYRHDHHRGDFDHGGGDFDDRDHADRARLGAQRTPHPPLERKEAVAILKRAGLEVSIESLPLSNVPTGFVISQNPLPAATAVPGSTVTLVVSAAA